MTNSKETAFHDGEIRVQALAGVTSPSSTFILPFMPEQHRDFFRSLSYVIIGGLSADGWPVATLVSGEPGFLRSPDETTLSIAWRPSPGDPLIDAIAADRPITVLGIEFATRRRNRANGVVLAVEHASIRMRVLQSYGNCPQYIRVRAARSAVRAPGSVERLPGLDAEAQALVSSATTFFVASYGPGVRQGGMDVSHRGGPVGFVRIDHDGILTVPDYPGNRYFNTFGNFHENPRAGLLFVDFNTGDMLHMRGDVLLILTGDERAFRFRIRTLLRRRSAVQLSWTEESERAAPYASGREGS